MANQTSSVANGDRFISNRNEVNHQSDVNMNDDITTISSINSLQQRINDLENEVKALKDEKIQWEKMKYNEEQLTTTTKCVVENPPSLFPIISNINEFHLLFLNGDECHKDNNQEEHHRNVPQEDETLNDDTPIHNTTASTETTTTNLSSIINSCLSNDEIKRYCRQLLVENGIIDVIGQMKINNSKVLVIGAGGIGSTVLMYLSGFGIGIIGIIDYDTIEISNLHRQIIHNNNRIGINKSISACTSIKLFNPFTNCHAITFPLNAINAIEIIEKYDIIIDASDNPYTRYIINDACVLSNKPLISGSAIGYEGQITIYNYNNGPCYRCLYPNPKISSSCSSCSDIGVYGPVPGIIGILQSMETIKIITSSSTTLHDRMILYDAIECTFRTMKKPLKHPKCPICSNNPTIQSMIDSQQNLLYCCGPSTIQQQSPSPSLSSANDSQNNISCHDYKELILDKNVDHILIDVRMKHQYEICSFQHAINIPLEDLITGRNNVYEQIMNNMLKTTNNTINGSDHSDNNTVKAIYCICRRGIASTEAAQVIQQYFHDNELIDIVRQQQYDGENKNHEESMLPMNTNWNKKIIVWNITDGLTAWQQQVDPDFPIY